MIKNAENKMKFLILTSTIAMMMIAPAVGTPNAFAEASTLPGGTAIKVTITSPTDGQLFTVPPGGTIDVPVVGTAEVAMGTLIKDTTVVYIIDKSGSMLQTAGVSCDGNASHDTKLLCAKLAVKAANQAAADPLSAVDLTGLGQFGDSAGVQDVDLTTPGTQSFVAPDFDSADGGTTPDLEDAVSSIGISGTTNYFNGLIIANAILAVSTSTNQLVIFISDGSNNGSPAVNTFDTSTLPPNTVFKSIAIGAGTDAAPVGCGLGSPGNNLVAVAALTPGGSCSQIVNPNDLADKIPQLIGSTLDSLELKVNGGGASAIPNSEINPDLPKDGPAMVDYSTTVTGLGSGTHEICVTASGTDAGGQGDVTECVDINVNERPVITAPDDITVECNEPGAASGVDLGEPTVSDKEDAEEDLVVENDATEPFSLGDTTVTWSVEDTQGASDSDTQTVTVEDTTDPEITVPDGFMVIANTNGGWSGDIGDATATDVCSDVTISNDAPDVFPLDDTDVTWCATDDFGNVACAIQTIFVKPLPVDIDIKPASDPNSINVKSNGVVPVAILGSDEIDVTLIDVTSLAFGPSGATPAHELTDAVIYALHLEDVPVIDGITDLVSHYKQKQIGLSSGDTEACITGTYNGGIPFEGCDAVNIK